MAVTAPTGLFWWAVQKRKKEEEEKWGRGCVFKQGCVALCWRRLRRRQDTVSCVVSWQLYYSDQVCTSFNFVTWFPRSVLGEGHAQNSCQHSELKSSVTANSLYISAVHCWIEASCDCFPLLSSVSSDAWMMDHSSNSDVTEFQQLWGSWNTLLDRVHDDPRVTSPCLSLPGNQSFACQPHLRLPPRCHSWWTQGLGSTWAATLSWPSQWCCSSPWQQCPLDSSSLLLLWPSQCLQWALFSLTVGVILSMAFNMMLYLAVLFIPQTISLFLSAVLLFVGGVSLLCVLSGIAFFSVMVSFIFNVFYIIASNILKSYYPHLTKVMCWRRVILL